VVQDSEKKKWINRRNMLCEKFACSAGDALATLWLSPVGAGYRPATPSSRSSALPVQSISICWYASGSVGRSVTREGAGRGNNI